MRDRDLVLAPGDGARPGGAPGAEARRAPRRRPRAVQEGPARRLRAFQEGAARRLRAFLASAAGFSGAERALLLGFGCALVLLVGAFASRGTGGAGEAAGRVLAEGRGAAGEIARPGALQTPGALAAPGEAPPPGEAAAPHALQSASAEEPPDHLPGTNPYAVQDRIGPFECFGACGASCSCAGRRDSTASIQVGGRSCTYQVTECNTHPFCVWHDQCYLDCDNSMPNALRRSGCYRQCDSACVTGSSPWSGYADPPGSYSLSDCVRWARHRDSAPATGRMKFSRLQGCQGPT